MDTDPELFMECEEEELEPWQQIDSDVEEDDDYDDNSGGEERMDICERPWSKQEKPPDPPRPAVTTASTLSTPQVPARAITTITSTTSITTTGTANNPTTPNNVAAFAPPPMTAAIPQGQQLFLTQTPAGTFLVPAGSPQAPAGTFLVPAGPTQTGAGTFLVPAGPGGPGRQILLTSPGTGRPLQMTRLVLNVNPGSNLQPLTFFQSPPLAPVVQPRPPPPVGTVRPTYVTLPVSQPAPSVAKPSSAPIIAPAPAPLTKSAMQEVIRRLKPEPEVLPEIEVDMKTPKRTGEMTMKVKESSFVTVLTDETTDISSHQRLLVYVQIIDTKTFEPSTHLVTSKVCTDGTGAGIAKSIREVMSELGIPLSKVMSVGSDGAAVMTEQSIGCSHILLRCNPHMVNVHCIGHSLAVCTTQAAEAISDLKEHQRILSELFLYFRGYSRRSKKIPEIHALLSDLMFTDEELRLVRWLSYGDALKTVLRNIDGLLAYFSHMSEHVVEFDLRQKIGTLKFISISALMVDVMAPVSSLSLFLQKEFVDVELVRVALEMAIEDLEKVKAMASPSLVALTRKIQGNMCGDFPITGIAFRLESLCIQFIDNLITNLRARFPNTSLLCAFGVLSLRPIPLMSEEKLKVFGNKDLEVLIAHYGSEKTHRWKENGRDHCTTTQPLIDAAQTRLEWALVKTVVKAQHYSSDSMWQLWALLTKNHQDQFPNLTILAQLATTLALHTAGCEQAFSSGDLILAPQGNILVPQGNMGKLSLEHKEQLLKVQPGPARSEQAVGNCKRSEDRNVYNTLSTSNTYYVPQTSKVLYCK